MTLKDIVVKLGFNVEHEKLSRVESQLQSIKNTLHFIAATEVVKGLVHLTERFTEFGVQLHLAAESAGLTAEGFQQLAFSAGQAGVSQDEMGFSMTRLSRNLYLARTGSAEAQAAFQNLGFSPDQVKGFRNSKDALLAMADKLKAIDDPIKRTALSQQLLGRGSLHMVGYLAQGSAAIRKQADEAKNLGIVLSGAQVNALVKAEHALQKFWAVLKSIGARVAADIAPAIEFFTNDFIKFFEVNRSIIELNLYNFLYGLGFVFGFLWGLIKHGIDLFTKFAKYLHFEGYLLPGLAVLGLLVTALLGVGATITVLMPIFSSLATAAGIAKAVFLAFRAEAIALAVDFGPIVIAVGALLVAFHDLWVVLNGGSFKDTWVGEAFEAIKGFGGKLLGGALNVGKLLFGSTTLGAEPSGLGPAALSAGPPVAAAAASHSVTIAPQLTIHTPPGTPVEQVGKYLESKITEHLGTMLRHTRASTATGVKY